MKLVIFSYLLLLLMPNLHAITPISPLESDNDWRTLTQTSMAQFQQHKIADAVASAQRALRIAKRFGAEDERLAVTYYQLGAINRDWGHCPEASAHFTHAIAIWEKEAVTNREYIFEAIAASVSALCECDDFNGAATLLRSYSKKLQLHPSGPLGEARLYSIRGAISRGNKKYKQAEDYYRQAVEVLQHATGVPPFVLLHGQIDLATVINRQGRHAEALGRVEQLITLLDQDASPSIALVWSLNQAACELADLGRAGEAQGMFERVLLLAEEFYGDDNRTTAKIMINYARVLQQNQQAPAAAAMKKRGVETFRRALARESATVDVANLRR